MDIYNIFTSLSSKLFFPVFLFLYCRILYTLLSLSDTFDDSATSKLFSLKVHLLSVHCSFAFSSAQACVLGAAWAERLSGLIGSSCSSLWDRGARPYLSLTHLSLSLFSTWKPPETHTSVELPVLDCRWVFCWPPLHLSDFICPAICPFFPFWLSSSEGNVMPISSLSHF